jgi:cytochrome c-type biogenesis protein CcmH/NrfG
VDVLNKGEKRQGTFPFPFVILSVAPRRAVLPVVRRLSIIQVGVIVALFVSTDLRARTNGQAEAIMAALRARDFDAAVERSREAVRTAPNDPQLWTLHGIALANKGKRTEALEAFDRALEISPNYVAALEGAA